MKPQYIFSILAAVLLFTGCAMESPFQEKGQGKILKSALDVKVNVDENVHATKASDDNLNLDDFVIKFIQDGKTAAEYKYSEMPDIVILSEGKYVCSASYGVNLSAAWDSPYYYGESKPFDVVAYEITGNIDPIVCRLGNVKVTVAFDESLASRVSGDASVNVKLDNTNSLDFNEDKISKGNAGYFKHGNESTLVAVFTGTIDGAAISTTKYINDIQNGSHYKLTFRLHDSDNTGTGSSSIKVVLDTSVTSDDYNPDGVTTDDEEVVVDPNEHPNEGEVVNPDDPNVPDNPDDPNVPDNPDDPNLPEITVNSPVKFGTVNEGEDMDECIIVVTSHAELGIQYFTCKIETTNGELKGLLEKMFPNEDEGSSDIILDLAHTPGSYADDLGGFLGFPINVAGKPNVEMELTNFLPALSGFSGIHQFDLAVTDDNGNVTKTLIIKYE